MKENHSNNVAFGLILGVVFGICTDNLALGLGLGVLFGMLTSATSKK